MLNVSGFMTATVSNTKITEVANKITDTKSLVTTTVLKKMEKLRTKLFIMLNILLLIYAKYITIS